MAAKLTRCGGGVVGAAGAGAVVAVETVGFGAAVADAPPAVEEACDLGADPEQPAKINPAITMVARSPAAAIRVLGEVGWPSGE